MKRPLFLLAFFIISLNCYSQSLAGEWKGNFVTYTNSSVYGEFSSVTLKFIPTADNDYEVTSYSTGINSKGKDITKVCKVFYAPFSNDSVYLEEKEFISTQDTGWVCLQKMSLKIYKRKKALILTGLWESVSGECGQFGKIFFKKKEH